MPWPPALFQTEMTVSSERQFFQLDVDGGGTITFAEMKNVLAFTAFDLSPGEVEEQLTAADTIETDGRLDRTEFLDLCIRMLWSHDIEQLKQAASSYAEFRAALKRRNNTYWRSWAHWIDRQCRFSIPVLYMVAMLLFWGLSFEDDYLVRGLHRAVTKHQDCDHQPTGTGTYPSLPRLSHSFSHFYTCI